MKKKRKLRHHMTRVLHPNRNFIWAIAISFIASLALFSYIVVTDVKFDTNNNGFVTTVPTRPVYTDNHLGYTVHYPSGWLLEKDANDNMIFENPHDLAESITVTPGSSNQATTIKRSLNIKEENNYQNNGFNIDRMVATTVKGSAQEFDAAILTSGKKLFYITGHSSFFDGFVNSFKLQ